jgi:hypothetical protein
LSNFYTGGGSRTSSQLVGTTNFLIEVAKGTVLGHSAIFKFGRNDEIDTGTDPEDIRPRRYLDLWRIIHLQ